MTPDEWKKLVDVVNCVRNNAVAEAEVAFGDWSFNVINDNDGFDIQVARPVKG